MALCLEDGFLHMLASEIRNFCQWMTYAVSAGTSCANDSQSASAPGTGATFRIGSITRL
ncbi:hypothetical protein MSR1_02730 [Magnetospirillum gryphiswaldense MSR-1]|nr:hypothetical protein MSR1_02730 [Magnetospirillum gryphiswaldense MSR-1]AVM76690.1 hypothetical protein MSR1L_02730 [Magnetospirillum gryphiswaldense]